MDRTDKPSDSPISGAVEPTSYKTVQAIFPVPESLVDFIEVFKTDDDCRKAIIKSRWPNGFICPRCQHSKGYEHHKRPLIECRSCGHQASATAGTILHGTKLPLKKLFLMLYLLVAEKDGLNARQMQRQCNINYKTARLWILKVRDLFFTRGKSPLTGLVEVDESVIGGPSTGNPGRAMGPNQRYALVMVEDKGAKCGRLRLAAVDDAEGDTLKTVVREHLADGAIARTDGLASYNDIESHEANEEKNIGHEVDVIGNPKLASIKFPKVHMVASLLKRLVMGTFQGSISMGWLPWLLAEFEFRFNRRNSKRRPLLFARLIEFGQSITRNKGDRTRKYFTAKGTMFRELGLS